MKKILVTLMTAMLIMASFVPVFAEKYDDNAPIKEATGTEVEFDKYLVMNKDAQVPFVDFLYVVDSDGAHTAPSAAGAADDEQVYPKVLIDPTGSSGDVKPVVWKGVRPDLVKVTAKAATDELDATGLTNIRAEESTFDWITASSVNVGELTFSPMTDTTVDGPYRDTKADIATSKEKYVKKQFKLDFTGIKFAEPGVYRYYVKEINGVTYSDLGITYDVNANEVKWRTVDVYVVDKDTRDYSSATSGDGELVIADYVWYEGKLTTNDKPDHTAGSNSSENAWQVDWLDTSGNKKYHYVSNNEWVVQVPDPANPGAWINEVPEEIVKEPPTNATGSITIDGKPYTTWGAAKAAMEAFDTKTLTPNGAEAGDKSSEYVNKYNTQDLEFGKKVIGNQGSRDQWFKFKVSLTNTKLEAGTKFEVNVGSYTNNNPANSNHFFNPTANSATSYTADNMKNANTMDKYRTDAGALAAVTNEFTSAKNILTPAATADNRNYLIVETKGSVEWEMYLQHGQYIQIKGIPNGVTYTVAETDPATGYKKTDGTDIEKGVIDGEIITNAHMDPLTGEIGNKGPTTYVKNPEGDYYLNTTTKKYEKLYINPADGKAYTESAYTNEWTGDRFFEDENVYTGVTNKRSGVIPTGIIMSVAGGFAIVMIAIGFLLMINRRRKEYDYE